MPTRKSPPDDLHAATLEVHDHPSSGSDGFIDTIASNDAVYSYRYLGGGKKTAGKLVGKWGHGRAVMELTLQPAPRYAIGSVCFSGQLSKTARELTWCRHGPNSGAVVDRNTVGGKGHYHVLVHDTAAGCTVPCDPMIANEPRLSH